MRFFCVMQSRLTSLDTTSRLTSLLLARFSQDITAATQNPTYLPTYPPTYLHTYLPGR